MIDIIVVTYNAKNKLRLCLQSIEKYTKDMPYRLTIVNNNSQDKTAEYLNKKYAFNQKAKIIHAKKNMGFSGAANLALKATSNKLVALLDDDVEVTKGWLMKLHQSIKKKPSIAIIGPKVMLPNKKIFCAEMIIWNHIILPVGMKEKDNGQRDYIRKVDALCGACWLIKRNIIKKIGFFDERFFPCQMEDVDYCVRARLAGYKIIYNGKITVIHHNLYRALGNKNWLRFVKKWPNLSMFPLKN